MHSIAGKPEIVVRDLMLLPEEWDYHYQGSTRFQHSGKLEEYLPGIPAMLQHNHAQDAVHRGVAQRDIFKVAADIKFGIIPRAVTIAGIQCDVSPLLEMYFMTCFPRPGIEYYLSFLQSLGSLFDFGFNQMLHRIQPCKDASRKHPFGKGFEP